MKTTLSAILGGIVLAGFADILVGAEMSSGSKIGTQSVRARPQPESTASQTNTVKKAGFPVIGYLEGRGKVIIIKSGAKGAVYSVKGDDGKFLFEDLTAEQLQAKAPEIHQFIKSAVAVNNRGGNATVDASLRMMHR